jgi:hypothetical protein
LLEEVTAEAVEQRLVNEDQKDALQNIFLIGEKKNSRKQILARQGSLRQLLRDIIVFCRFDVAAVVFYFVLIIPECYITLVNTHPMHYYYTTFRLEVLSNVVDQSLLGGEYRWSEREHFRCWFQL